MNIYRFHFAQHSRITFACSPRNAILWAARFARLRGAELTGIELVRSLTHQLELRA